MIVIQFYGTAKSKYDQKVRAMASQYQGSEMSLYSFESALKKDIETIPRANIAVASTQYRIRHKNEFTNEHEVEIWNDSMPGKERLIATITNKS
ncbi:MAG: hypothetical protein ACK5DD_10330 [Cyclobacteriaceae bacterium]|jgi:hypothetical protein